MVVLRILMFITLFWILSCQNKYEDLPFGEFNNIVNKGLTHILWNDCFHLRDLEKLHSHKAMEIYVDIPYDISIDSTIQFYDFDINSFLKEAKTITFPHDTLQFKSIDSHLIYPTRFKLDRDIGVYLRQYNHFYEKGSNHDFIHSILIRKPKVLDKNNNKEILIEFDRHFEYIIDRIFILITTDNNFKVQNIKCLEQIKIEIPKPTDFEKFQ